MTMKSKNLLNLTKNLTILYVEDDIPFNKETSEILEDFFQSVEVAYDGIEALNKYKEYYINNKKYYDLIISDINMPKMDGITLTKEIYKINESQSIIINSAYNESEYLIELVNLGVERFLLKPFKYDELIEVLFNILNKKSNSSNIVKLSDTLTWSPKEELLKDNENIIKLTQKETLILKLFIKNGSKISTTNEIFNYVWSDNISLANTDSLKALISRLRKKLNGTNIESIYNIGYRLNF